MYRISDLTKQNIERAIGLDLASLKKMTALEEREWLEQKQAKKPVFSKRRKKGITGRGNPLISRRKFRTEEDLEVISKKIFGI